jgi:hypothetical protein
MNGHSRIKTIDSETVIPFGRTDVIFQIPERKEFFIMKRTFIITLLAVLLSTTLCFAGHKMSDGGCLELIKGGRQIYLELQCHESVHVYWATYDISYNHGSIKTNEGTHSTYLMDISNRPTKNDENGYLTDAWLTWLSKMNHTHLTSSGEKIVLLSSSGLDRVRTEKNGKYYIYVWKNDAKYNQFVKWCREHGLEPGK